MEFATPDGLRSTAIRSRITWNSPVRTAAFRGVKNARRPRSAYHFTDGFVQDLQGEATTCRECKQSVRVSPVVLVHDKDEKRRFEAMFGTAFEADLEVSKN